MRLVRRFWRISLSCLMLGWVLIPQTLAQSELVLDRAQAVRELSEEMADRRLPARITGVVTFYFPARGMLFVQDAGHGLYVGLETGALEIPWLKPGVLVQVDGRTSSGGFMSCLMATRSDPILLTPLSFPGLPEPRMIDAGSLVRQANLDCEWVEVRGEVAKMNVLADHLDLSLRHAGDAFGVSVPLGSSEDPPPWNLVGKQVIVRGVVATQSNARRQMTGRVICAPSVDQILVVSPEETDPFSLPVQPLNTVLRIHQPNVNASAVHVQGVVTYVNPNEGLCVQGDSGSLWIHPAQPVGNIMLGDLLDIVGRPVLRAFKPELESAQLQVIGRGKTIKPRLANGASLWSGTNQTDLVSVEGILIDFHQESEDVRLLLRVNDRMVRVVAPKLSQEGAARSYRLQSKLKVVGVCRALGTHSVFNAPPPSELTLWVSRPTDIHLLRSGPPFGLEDLALVLQLLGIVALACAVWAFMLRRRVAQLTGLVHEQLQTSTREDERVRIARELHDSLQQHLVGLGLQLRTGLSHLPDRPEQARKLLETADQMLRHSLTEAHQSVWDLRTTLGTEDGVYGAVRSILLPISDRARWALDISVSPKDLVLPGSVQHECLRIIQEAVTNAIRHGRATRISVTIKEELGAVSLEVSDDGVGFDPAILNQPQRICFGLVGMKERATRIGAKLSVTSARGQGTSVRVLGVTQAGNRKSSKVVVS